MIIGNNKDNSNRTSAESLQISEIRYRRLFETARDGILILDAVTRKITDVNPFMIEHLGYSREEFLGKELWEIGLLKDEEESIATFEELQNNHYIRYEDLPLETKTGERKEVEFISNVYSEDGRQVVQCNIRDITVRKKLEKNTYNMAAIVESSNDAIISKNLDGIILTWNKAAENIFGYKSEEVVGQNIIILFPPELFAEETEILEKIKHGEFIQNFETTRLKKDGSRISVSLIHSPIKNSKGEIIGVSKIAHDTTTRRLKESELQASEAKFRQLVESSIIGIITTNLNGAIIEANDIFLKMVGYTRAELLAGKLRWDEMTPAEFRLEDERKEITEFGATKPHEKEYIRKDGNRIPILVGGTLLKNSNGNIIAFVLDISEQKRAKEALRKAEENYRHLVESSPGIVYLNEPNPPYLNIYVSPNVEKFGYSAEEWATTPNMWSSILYQEDRERVLKEFETARAEGLETDIRYRITAHDGTIHWWQDKGRFVSDENGNRTGWQGIILDITATKLLEHQLQEAQKLESIGLLAGGIAHDFNNMLTAINGYSELTLRELKKDDPLRNNIEEIRKAGQRSASLTRQLLAFSRQQLLKPIVADLNEIIGDTINMLQRVIGEDIYLTTTLDPKIGRVKVDLGQFSQIVMNLAVNARDAMPNGGKLTIETANIFLDATYTQQHLGTLVGDYVMLAVSDTGSGMNAETKQHIFEPFFTTKEIGQGTGLGLATVYGIVKQSNGNIEVYSEQGVGTTFKVYFPRFAGQFNNPPIKTADSAMSTGTEKILLVEDEEMIRNLGTEILEMCGYTVIAARNGFEALKICDSGDHQFALLMTDVVMPQMGGRELAEKLTTRLPNLKILFTSGYTDDAVVRHGVIEANTNFIQKPFSPDALANKIREILDKA